MIDLPKACELLTDESKWTKYRQARDRVGDGRCFDSPDAVCWCVQGALARVTNLEEPFYGEASRRLGDAVKKLGYTDAPSWNDDPCRTFAEVRSLLLELDL